MIHVRGLTKSYGSIYALRGVDLNVESGESVTIVGPNGAGKTTLLRILATLLNPSSGKAWIDGMDLSTASYDIRAKLGFASHRSLVYDNLTVEENLAFYGKLYRVPGLAARTENVLRTVGLLSRRRSRAGTLSRGMQQRLSLARAIIHKPDLMLLDEPYAGLDQESAAMLEVLLDAVRGEARTVIMTTHNLERGLSRADRVVILAKGRIAFEAPSLSLTLQQLRDAYWEHCREGRGVEEGSS
ncbi:MAG: heme ABC exporter ATP-binding protein CcmA [Candidatus Bipolaricaulota bacterium]